MSTSSEEQTDPNGGKGGRFRLVLRAFAATVAIASAFLLWSSERVRVSHDLQLISEAVAKPGEVLAVRAVVLRNLDAPSGPELVGTEVSVELRDAQERTVGEALLTPRVTGSMEGAVRIPETASGPLMLQAKAQPDEALTLICRRPIHVQSDAPLLAEHRRPAGPLQHLSLGALRKLSEEPPPSPFLPRVSGGACLPEERCMLLVWVGQPAAAVVARGNEQVSVSGPAVPAHETEGIVALEVVPHGLDAQLTLEAHRAGQAVAERSLRLPLGHGEVGVYIQEPLLAPDATPVIFLALPPGREHAIVDVFLDGRWRATQSVANVVQNAPFELDGGLVPAGRLVRVQPRTDRFSSDGAGTRFLVRRAPGTSDAAALAWLAGQVSAHASETRAWARALPAFALADAQRTAAFLLAPLELTRVPLPEAVSSRPEQLARVARSQAFLRFGVAGMLVLGAVIVGVSLMRRGLSAADEARAIITEAREGGDAEPGQRSDTRLGVILFVLSVALAFLAGALLIVAKSLWF